MTAKESPVRYPGLPSEPATALPEVSSLLPCSYQGELKERGGGQTGLLVLVLVDCPEEAKSLKPFWRNQPRGGTRNSHSRFLYFHRFLNGPLARLMQLDGRCPLKAGNIQIRSEFDEDLPFSHCGRFHPSIPNVGYNTHYTATFRRAKEG